MICTFFGHRDAPNGVSIALHTTLLDLIENKGVTQFYVGNNGLFDEMVIHELIQIEKIYPHITWAVVLSHIPIGKTYGYNTVFPDNIELVLPKYAIDKRNRWMLQQAQFVVMYVKYPFGGAAKYAHLAIVGKKTVINLAEGIKTNDNGDMV